MIIMTNELHHQYTKQKRYAMSANFFSRGHFFISASRLSAELRLGCFSVYNMRFAFFALVKLLPIPL